MVVEDEKGSGAEGGVTRLLGSIVSSDEFDDKDVEVS